MQTASISSQSEYPAGTNWYSLYEPNIYDMNHYIFTAQQE